MLAALSRFVYNPHNKGEALRPTFGTDAVFGGRKGGSGAHSMRVFVHSRALSARGETNPLVRHSHRLQLSHLPGGSTRPPLNNGRRVRFFDIFRLLPEAIMADATLPAADTPPQPDGMTRWLAQCRDDNREVARQAQEKVYRYLEQQLLGVALQRAGMNPDNPLSPRDLFHEVVAAMLGAGMPYENTEHLRRAFPPPSTTKPSTTCDGEPTRPSPSITTPPAGTPTPDGAWRPPRI